MEAIAPISVWIRRYFTEDQVSSVMAVLAMYGGESWHREPARVKRDALILSRGSLEVLDGEIRLAMQDYRDVLVGEEVDPWVQGELSRYGP